MNTANEYEIAWWKEGKEYIIGIDEAGRGPIAGPLVVAGVCFPKNYHHDEIYDSKKLSDKKRKQLLQDIIKDALEYHVLIIPVDVIDHFNIYRATQMAMQEITTRFQKGDGVLSDAMPLPMCEMPVIALVKGDQKSVSIAAASILAKEVRDGIMRGYDCLFPTYGFAKHKGYPTKKHLEELHTNGILAIHRKSYGPVAALSQMQLDI